MTEPFFSSVVTEIVNLHDSELVPTYQISYRFLEKVIFIDKNNLLLLER